MFSFILAGLAATAALVSAFFWVKSAAAEVPAPPGSQGVGALLGGDFVWRKSNGDRIDLPETIRLQSVWNRYAAYGSAVTAILGAFALIAQLLHW